MEQQDIKNKIWTSLDSLRADINFSGFRDTKLLEIIGLIFGLEKLDQIFTDKELLFKLTNIDRITPPTYVFSFINDLLISDNINSMFDPWLTLSSASIYLKTETIKGICKNQSEFEIINSLFSEKNIKAVLGDSLTELGHIYEKYDLIISFPPFGVRTEYIARIKRKTDFATTLLLETERLLSEKGKMIFLLSPSFLLDDKAKSLIENVGLFIEAVFSIPSGAFAPMTRISLNLVLVSRKTQEKTFVAEISQDANTNNTIIQNFKNRKEGKTIQLGGFVDIKEFKSLHALISQKEMQELVKRIGFPPILLMDISNSINVLKVDNTDEVENLANSIYFPKIGNSPVISSIFELKIKPKNCYQIQLDETKANAFFVANYFNTQIGKKLRESLAVGTVIPQISKSQLSKCVLHLPDLATQAKLIELDSKIQQFTLRLDELKRNLWKQPRGYKSIEKDLKDINQEEKLENWIDKLPFPISSILWRYYATKDISKRIEHLFHFFEAFSEFISMIMLSALVQDKDFYNKERYKWIDTNERFQNWYLRASFGNWNMLTSRLSKAVREYLADKDKKDYCRNLFGNPSDSFLNMFINKGTVNVLNEVANLRNKWKGHGGITSEEENKHRILTLEQQLNQIRKIIDDGFQETIILSPNTSSFEDGVFTFIAKELIGARTPFNETTIKSLIPLDRKKLYLAHNYQNKPLELIPFIKYIEASDAIYFYTSIESKDVRWVSYHFDKESEITQPVDNELFKVFDFLKP